MRRSKFQRKGAKTQRLFFWTAFYASVFHMKQTASFSCIDTTPSGTPMIPKRHARSGGDGTGCRGVGGHDTDGVRRGAERFRAKDSRHEHDGCSSLATLSAEAQAETARIYAGCGSDARLGGRLRRSSLSRFTMMIVSNPDAWPERICSGCVGCGAGCGRWRRSTRVCVPRTNTGVRSAITGPILRGF